MSFEPAVLHTVTAYHTPPGPANKPEVWARARLVVLATPFDCLNDSIHDAARYPSNSRRISPLFRIFSPRISNHSLSPFVSSHVSNVVSSHVSNVSVNQRVQNSVRQPPRPRSKSKPLSIFHVINLSNRLEE